ncbi:peptide chain release factor 1 [Planctomycetota bacterium]
MTESNSSLLNKLDELAARYEEIDTQIADPAVASNPLQLIALSKEQGKLRPIVTKYRNFQSTCSELTDAEQITNDSAADEDMRAFAAEEITELRERQAALQQELQNTLVMADDMTVGSLIMEIRPGTGGEEAALFARDLYNMYIRYAEIRRWKVEQLDFSAADMGGLREAIIGIKGEGAWADLGYEGGGHRVQRVPETESQGRIHTSAATVAVLPEPEEIEIEIDPAEVIEHVCRSSGPGGQNVNKVSSAIRLEHVPTGITVSMQDEKSQHKNRAKAWRILRSRLYERYEKEKRAARDSQRNAMIGSGDRSSKIRTYNFPQNRVTDHRIGVSLYSLDKILAGDLHELVAALKEYDLQERLKNL